MSGIYRITERLDKLRLRVRLRILHDAGAHNAPEKEADAQESKVGRIFAYTFKWQEKVEGPDDVLGKKAADAKEKKIEAARDRIASSLDDRGHACFTYVDRDDFSPLDDPNGRALLKDAMGVAAPTLQTALAASRAHKDLRAASGWAGSAAVERCVESQPIQDTVQRECSGTNFWGLSL